MPTPVSSNRVVLGLDKGSSDELLGRIKPLVPSRGTTASHTDKFNWLAKFSKKNNLTVNLADRPF
jgi:hypothetical protein